MLYSSSITVICGDGFSKGEKGEVRYCRRCRDSQYLDVEMWERVPRPVPTVQREPWEADPDAWKVP